MDGIFISYRRDDAAGYAGRLYDRLAAHFGPSRVFMDVEGIEPGTDFVEAIEGAVGSCRAMIVMIGNEWLGARDGDGRLRLDDPHDFVRIEAGFALRRNIRVVPVLVEGAVMPRLDQLPDELKSLARRQAIEISHKQWEASTGELIKTLERLLGSEAAAGGTTPSTGAPSTAEPEPAKPQSTPATDDRTPGAGSRSVSSDKEGTDKRKRWVVAASVVLALIAGLALWLKPARVGDPATPAGPVAPSAATDAPEPPSAALESDVEKIDFGSRASGTTASAGVVVRNTGKTAVAVERVAVEGPQASDFTPDQACRTQIEPGASCRVGISFKPAAPGKRDARLLIAVAGSATKLDLPLSGTVEAPPPPMITTEPAVASPAPIAAAAPRIDSFTVQVKGNKATLCYRTLNAERSELAPRPGMLANTARGCVVVALNAATTFTLSARSNTGNAEKSIDAAPQPMAIAEPKPDSVPPLAYTAPATATTGSNPAFPRKGESWTYRMRGKWGNSPVRTLEFSLVEADGRQLQVRLAQIADGSVREIERKNLVGTNAELLQWHIFGLEFAPFLVPFGGVDENTSWSTIPTPEFDSNWRNWHSYGKVVGRERVDVPAGSFDALKVELWSSRTATGSVALMNTEPTRVYYLVWYAPEVKRYVKMKRQLIAAANNRMEEDTFELMSYRKP